MTGLETPTWVKYAGDLAFLVIFLVFYPTHSHKMNGIRKAKKASKMVQIRLSKCW